MLASSLSYTLLLIQKCDVDCNPVGRRYKRKRQERKEEDLSALRAQAICSLLVMAREAPSMWPSSRITLSQCTCTP